MIFTRKNKQKNKQKYLFVARGPGESSQARALALYVRDQGHSVSVALLQKANKLFFNRDKDLDIYITETPMDLKKLAKRINPDALLFFNSKLWSKYENFIDEFSFLNSVMVSVDSNWLFNNKKYPFYKYIKNMDLYLINIHPEVFGLGLEENGGDFSIEENIKNKVRPVGFIPTFEKINSATKINTRNKFGISGEEKLIFNYISGLGASMRDWVFYNLVSSLDLLISQGVENIKVVSIGDPKKLKQEYTDRPWIKFIDSIESNDFYNLLASSDLVFQHQGLATLSQAISARVPVIANVSKLPKEKLAEIHFWEVGPFEKAGLCRMLNKDTPHAEMSKEIKEFLFNEDRIKAMIDMQNKFYMSGEAIAYNIIQELIKNNNEKTTNRANRSS